MGLFLLFDDPERRRRRDRWLFAIGVLLAIALVVRAARKEHSVIDVNQEFGRRFLERSDPYLDPGAGPGWELRVHGPYPPSYALVCAPLALVPERAVRVVWVLLQVGALAASYVLLRRWLARAVPAMAPHAPVVFAVGFVIASRYVLRDMAGGGGNLLYATAALWGIELALTKRWLAGGALLALPIVVKPSLAPLAFAPLFLGNWRAFAATCATALALAWLPGAWFGAQAWAALWKRWLADALTYAATTDLDVVPEGYPDDHWAMNQSLRAALERVVGPGELAVGFARAAIAVVLVAAAWACARARDARQEIFGALAFVPAALLASPIAWKAHHAGILCLLALLAALALERRRWSALATFLALYWVACGLSNEGTAGSAAKEALQQASIVTWFTIALFLVTLRAQRTKTGVPPSPGAA